MTSCPFCGSIFSRPVQVCGCGYVELSETDLLYRHELEQEARLEAEKDDHFRKLEQRW